MNRREAEELLPWFVAGSLSDEEAQAVQAFIDSGAIAPEELESLETFAETVAERGAEEPVYNPAILERAMQQLDGIEQEQPEVPLVVSEAGASKAATADKSPGLIQRLLDTLQWSVTPPLARLVVAGQFALLLGLVVILAGREPASTEVVSTTVAGTTVAQAADFTLSFAPGASEADIRALFLANGISIVAGPSALGMYEVALTTGIEPDQAQAALSASPLVLFVQPVPQS